MLTKEQLKQKYEAFHEHFNFKDFLGLSALIFGLLMSNSSFDTGPAEVPPTPVKAEVLKTEETQPPKIEAIQTLKKQNKKVLQVPKKKRQPITASSKTL